MAKSSVTIDYADVRSGVLPSQSESRFLFTSTSPGA